MKQLSVWGLCLFVVIGLCGCSEPGAGPEGITKSSEKFPEFLTGTWKADASKWQVTFGDNGKVISAINTAGMSLVMADGGLIQPGKTEGSFLYFTYGPCWAEYEPKTRLLSVTITIEDMRMEFPQGALDGSMKYQLAGEVSEDAKGWRATVSEHIKVVGLEDTDPNAAASENLLFRRVEDN